MHERSGELNTAVRSAKVEVGAYGDGCPDPDIVLVELLSRRRSVLYI